MFRPNTGAKDYVRFEQNRNQRSFITFTPILYIFIAYVHNIRLKQLYCNVLLAAKRHTTLQKVDRRRIHKNRNPSSPQT